MLHAAGFAHACFAVPRGTDCAFCTPAGIRRICVAVRHQTPSVPTVHAACSPMAFTVTPLCSGETTGLQVCQPTTSMTTTVSCALQFLNWDTVSRRRIDLIGRKDHGDQVVVHEFDFAKKQQVVYEHKVRRNPLCCCS
jgi:hypothetical protein